MFCCIFQDLFYESRFDEMYLSSSKVYNSSVSTCTLFPQLFARLLSQEVAIGIAQGNIDPISGDIIANFNQKVLVCGNVNRLKNFNYAKLCFQCFKRKNKTGLNLERKYCGAFNEYVNRWE